MLIDLAPTVTALVVPGPPAAARPGLWLNSPAVVLRPDTGGGLPDDEPTVGSRAWLWRDDEDWRFDAGSGLLTSLVLDLPEVNLPTDPGLRDWDDAPTVTGTLRLEQLRGFSRRPTIVRWYDPAGTALAGFYSQQPAVLQQPRRRVALADQTHLLIAGNTLVGWSIKEPARYLTGESIPPSAADTVPDVRLPPLLAAFFSLVSEENLDKLEEGDSAIRNGLEELSLSLEGIAADGEPRAAEILTKVRQVLEDFSPEPA
jgi:hypothetical protein